MRVSHLILGAAFAALLLLGACQCAGPCDGVHCPEGEVCQAGLCVPDGADGGGAECSSDTDCAGLQGRTHCDVAGGRCVQCIVTSHCPDPEQQVCDTSTWSCIPRPPCTSDAQCSDLPATPRCEATSGRCVNCTQNAHCTGKQQVCDPTTYSCRFLPCTGDAFCQDYPETPYCDRQSGQCEACVEDGHCPTGEVCRNGACQPEGECTRDEACAPGQRCNTLQGPGVCQECITATDCRLGGRCIGGECGPGGSCMGDADCGAPLHCDTVASTCVACTTDAHCGPGQTCSGGVCTAPSSCGPQAACLPGEVCDGGACVPDTTCQPDAFEPNDLPYAAAPLENGRQEGLTLCPNTWDWYVLRAAVGDGLRLRADYDPAQGHPTLLVWAGDGSGPVLIGQPRLDAAGQSLEIGSLARPGPIYVGLQGIGTALDYALEVEVVEGGLCEDDALEPNDASTLATPLPPPQGGITSADAVACFANDDWFSVDVPVGMRVLATATATEGSDASLVVSLFVQESGGTLRLVGGDGDNTAEAPARGVESQYLIRITQAALGGTPYHLEVRLRPPEPPNDRCSGAQILSENVPVEGTTAGGSDDGQTLCGGDGSADVVYTFTLAQTRAVTITTQGALDAVLALRSACEDPQAELLCSDVPGDVETLTAVLPAGSYWVWVDGYGGREGPFSIELSTGAPPAPPPYEDCAQGRLLDEAAGGGVESGDVAVAGDDLAASCGAAGGDAVYLLTLSAPASLDLELAGDPALSVSVRSDCQDPATELGCAAPTPTAPATLALPYLGAGTYALVVDGGGIRGGAYTLTWALGSPIPPPSNDDCANPVFLATPIDTQSGDTRNARDDFTSACIAPGSSAGDVVYSFTLLSPQQVTAQVQADFPAVLSLRGPTCEAAAERQCSDGPSARVYEPALPAGVWLLVVDGYGDGDAGTFSLDFQVEAPLSVPANDTCGSADLLDLSSGTLQVTGYTYLAANDLDLSSSCTGSPTAGPEVFYAIDLLAGQTLTATVTPEAGYDPALYLLDACDATACLAGVDAYFVSEPETLTYTSSADARVYLAVDAYAGSEAGRYTLDLSVQ
ncbi:MAG: hypothetical protein D6729_06835 [Deltaproteobacteria bacterium]|nr:MAG: hypothetical protein D6729_06835 [Deltaproteobacteria bacterium]